MCDLVFNIEETDDIGRLQTTTPQEHDKAQTASTAVFDYCPDLTNPLIEIADIKRRVEQIPLKSAVGQPVDFAVIIDEEIPDWDFKLSSNGSCESIDRVDIVWRKTINIMDSNIGLLSVY